MITDSDVFIGISRILLCTATLTNASDRSEVTGLGFLEACAYVVKGL